MSIGSFVLSLGLVIVPTPVLRVPAIRDAVVRAVKAERTSDKEKGRQLAKLLYSGMTLSDIEDVLGGQWYCTASLGRTFFRIYPHYGLTLYLNHDDVLRHWEASSPERALPSPSP
jgi:hypothetical protein